MSHDDSIANMVAHERRSPSPAKSDRRLSLRAQERLERKAAAHEQVEYARQKLEEKIAAENAARAAKRELYGELVSLLERFYLWTHRYGITPQQKWVRGLMGGWVFIDEAKFDWETYELDSAPRYQANEWIPNPLPPATGRRRVKRHTYLALLRNGDVVNERGVTILSFHIQGAGKGNVRTTRYYHDERLDLLPNARLTDIKWGIARVVARTPHNWD